MEVFRSLVAIILVLLQQGLVIFTGIVALESSLTIGIVIFLICIPMLWVNKMTWKYIHKYGVINFNTINADTSEIDVPKGKRWYDK